MSKQKINSALSLLDKTVTNGMVNVKQLVSLDQVRDKFVGLYNNINNTDKGELFYAAEQANFLSLINNNSALKKCTPMSLYQAFINAAINGLSFSEHKRQCYLVPAKGLCKLWITPYGEAEIRINRGVIKHYEPPVIVYDCDGFEYGFERNETVLTHKPVKPPRPKEAEIIGSYIKITRPDNSSYIVWFPIDFFLNLRERYSLNKNSKAWDDLPAMIKAKTIKHAMNKLPQSIGSLLSGQKGVEVEQEEVIEKDYYSFEDTKAEEVLEPEIIKNEEEVKPF